MAYHPLILTAETDRLSESQINTLSFNNQVCAKIAPFFFLLIPNKNAELMSHDKQKQINDFPTNQSETEQTFLKGSEKFYHASQITLTKMKINKQFTSQAKFRYNPKLQQKG